MMRMIRNGRSNIDTIVTAGDGIQALWSHMSIAHAARGAAPPTRIGIGAIDHIIGPAEDGIQALRKNMKGN